MEVVNLYNGVQDFFGNLKLAKEALLTFVNFKESVVSEVAHVLVVVLTFVSCVNFICSKQTVVISSCSPHSDVVVFHCCSPGTIRVS